MPVDKNILVIAAHPDDEVLGVGATIAKKAAQGFTISVVFLATRLTLLKKNAQNAAEILKIKELHFLDFPDNRLDSVAKMDITDKLKEVVAVVKPQIVFTHHHSDYNWDHGIAFETTLMACRPNPGDEYPSEIYSYEVLSSTERAFQTGNTAFTPDVFEDVSATIALKQKALACYETELKVYPHPRSSEAIEYLARKRGGEVGLHHAEAFQLIRKINS